MTPTIAKSQETLDLAVAIVKGVQNVALLEMNLTIKQTLSQPLVKSVFKGENGSIGFSVVRVLVTRFLESFGFSTKHTDIQIDTITVDTLTNFEYESLQDIVLFFKMARSGKFGATIKGVDSNLIFGDWFPKYLELKSIEREILVQNDKVKVNNEISENVISKYYENHRKKLKFEKEFKETCLEIDKMCKDMDRQILEDTILDWSKKEEMKPYLDYLKRKRLVIK